MFVNRKILFASFALSTSMALGQSNLPVQVQADTLKTQIVDSLARGDSRAVLQGIAEYRALNVAVPVPLLFTEAKLAAAQKDYSRAQNALDEYFKAANASDAKYNESLRLYPQVKQGADAARQAGAVAVVKAIKAQMVQIPAGQFQMGSRDNDDEQPIHNVNVKAFLLSKYEVTFDQYDTFAQMTGRALPANTDERGNRPVFNVDWDDAQAFITWLNQVSGLKFRLPSEAEWEYAARAGSNTTYPWGNEFDANKANGRGTIGADQWSSTAPVGSFPANAFGLYDMIGNVWEWTQDCYNTSYEKAPTDGSAWLAGTCSYRVFCGGSWGRDPTYLRVSARNRLVPTFRNTDLGFRLAQDL